MSRTEDCSILVSCLVPLVRWTEQVLSSETQTKVGSDAQAFYCRNAWGRGLEEIQEECQIARDLAIEESCGEDNAGQHEPRMLP